MAEIVGVVKLLPVPKELPPEATEYQFKVPLLAVAPSVTVPASQREPGKVEFIINVPTVAVTAILEETQLPLVAST